MRTRFETMGDRKTGKNGFSRAAFTAAFSAIADRFAMQWQLHDATARPAMLLLVSRFDHCLNDLLYRYRTGTLPIDIPAIISNHTDLAPLAEWHDIPFFHIPVTAETKPAAEAQLRDIIDESGAEFVVLARYMQILSPELCAELAGREGWSYPVAPCPSPAGTDPRRCANPYCPNSGLSAAAYRACRSDGAAIRPRNRHFVAL